MRQIHLILSNLSGYNITELMVWWFIQAFLLYHRQYTGGKQNERVTVTDDSSILPIIKDESVINNSSYRKPSGVVLVRNGVGSSLYF